MLEDGDDAFNWPWIYAVQVGEWGFTEQEAKVMREYLLRGGFFMADDFHGDYEWEMFLKRIRFVFPDRPIVDIPDDDAIFHTVFDLNDRFQIPGAAHLYQGCKNCREGGQGAHWRGIYDDKGRIMVAISYNSDVGDAWEFADDPTVSGEVFRLGDSRRRELRDLRHDALDGTLALLTLRQFVLPRAHLGLRFAMNVAHLGAGGHQRDKSDDQQGQRHHAPKNQREAPRHGPGTPNSVRPSVDTT